MPRLRFAASVRLFSALIFIGALAWAQAAELGEPVVRSHLGQPLVADIELTALADPGTPVVVRVSSADVYKEASIAMHPVLASMNMSVMRREGRQFLHLTSVKPVDSENVHLFLDLTDGSRRNVRAVTLWLTPDPAPAPAPRPPAALPAPVAEPVRAIDPVAAPMPAPPRKAPTVVSAAVSAPAADPAPRAARARAARVITVPGSGTCPQPQFSEEQIKTCAAIDYKNGLLSAQIVELEDKVKQLQVAMEGKLGGPTIVGGNAQHAQHAPPPAPAKPAPKSAPKPGSGTGLPWLLVIGIVLVMAVAAGAAWFVLSRGKGKTVETAAADSVAWYSRLAAPFRRKAKVVAVVGEEPKDA